MNIPHIAQSSSDLRTVHAPSAERGIALIVVLLLMAVLSGLATGFAMTGNVEVQMGTNEVYYAGARAAAEAGLNRAIVEIINDTTHNLLAGWDNDAAATADNGKLTAVLGGPGPYALDAAGQYTYEIEILDDDNDALYETPLTAAQVTLMGENPKDPNLNKNDRLILRAIGHGPNGTIVRIARVLETVDTVNTATTNTPALTDAAILVNGDFEMNGNITVDGLAGSVHANGNLSKTGASGYIQVNATASGTYSGPTIADGATGGGRPTITVPDIHASDYALSALYKLGSDGKVYTHATPTTWNTVACTTAACKGTGWTFGGGTWSSGKTPTSAIYYVEGNVSIGPTSGKDNKAVSVIATGNIDVQSSSASLTTAPGTTIQFVCDGDLTINASDIDDTTQIEGQILVRGQMEAGGSMEFQGRVIVQDVPGAGTLVGNGASRIHGSVNFTYNGTLGDLSTYIPVVTTGPTTYVNNVTGWMEQ